MSIRAIDLVSVHKICSGQVITDLSSAVKELIENSLDSGATVIEIKLKNLGGDSIEVSDNGAGIEPSNYSGLARKHHTSKLQQFSDLSAVSSFGFRGEALNALCELSGSFAVATRQHSEMVASSLSFKRNGDLDRVAKVSRAPGTSVVVSNLFELLPVRRSELLRSLKKQYVRLLKLVQSYAVISVGVKISLITLDKGGRNAVIDTKANSSLPDNISFVFGSKFLQTMCPFEVEIPIPTPDNDNDIQVNNIPVCNNTNGSINDGEAESSASRASTSATATTDAHSNTPVSSDVVRISGYVSKAGVGVGRSDNDRQFLFCNGRPVDLPKITRTMNEVWRKYEMKQKPAYIMNVITPSGTFDVNISPDKREIVLTNEGLIIDSLKAAIDKLYESSRYTFQVNTPLDATSQTQLSLGAFSSVAVATPISNVTATITLPTSSGDTPPTSTPVASLSGSTGSHVTEDCTSPPAHHNMMSGTSEEVLHSQSTTKDIAKNMCSNGTSNSSSSSIGGNSTPNGHVHSPAISGLSSDDPLITDKGGEEGCEDVMFIQSQKQQSQSDIMEVVEESGVVSAVDADESTMIINSVNSNKRKRSPDHTEQHSTSIWSFDPIRVLQDVKRSRALVDSRVEYAMGSQSMCGPTPNDVEAELETGVGGSTDGGGMEIPGPTTSTPTAPSAAVSAIAGEEGIRVLCKEDFRTMEVLGQFNLGFIIAKLRGDLYILDQHACDEKYRFETLQESTVIHQQPLIRPMCIDLTCAEELVVADNECVFSANGFKLETDLSQPSGQRVKLLAVPFSKGIQFGVEDVRELASMLMDDFSASSEFRSNLSLRHSYTDQVHTIVQEGEQIKEQSSVHKTTRKNTGVRLPKLLAMYASRSCRQSVMIGTALSEREMSNIVRQLKGIEQPWNCPHGRPTMRHLADMSSICGSRRKQLQDRYILGSTESSALL